MQDIKSGLEWLAVVSIVLPLVYLILSINKIKFQNLESAIKAAIYPAIKALIAFGETFITVFVVGIVMQGVFEKPDAPANGYNQLIEGAINWLSILFCILWSKYSIQIIKEVSEAPHDDTHDDTHDDPQKDTHEGSHPKDNSRATFWHRLKNGFTTKYNRSFLILMYVLFLIVCGMLQLFHLAG